MSTSLFVPFHYPDALPLSFNYPYVRHHDPLLTALVTHCQQQLVSPDLSKEGCMMGVLAVKNGDGQLGYVMASSQISNNASIRKKRVPPLIDYSCRFYQQATMFLEQVQQQITQTIQESDLVRLEHQITLQQKRLDHNLKQAQQYLHQAKQLRRQQRVLIRQSDLAQSQQRLALLAKYSSAMKQVYQQCQRSHRLQYQQLKSQLDELHEITSIAEQQTKNSFVLMQQQIISKKTIKSAKGKVRSLSTLMKTDDNAVIADQVSPALLHYANQHELRPIAMTEFWWGGPAKEAVRHHSHCYPSNQTVCQPVLDFMLQGVTVGPNPLLAKAEQANEIKIIYQDDVMVVIDKPEHLLSVTGRDIKDSVQQRMQDQFPLAEGDMIVHRLDMETSGVMVLALTKKAHRELQQQFINRTVKKRYIALLDGIVEQGQGIINLPIRTDFKDRPRQRICELYGKKAITQWQVLAREEKQTLMAFYPQTGRTHQIRVHAAHWRGLGRPIVGDSLYGQPANRLCLHAEQLIINHPVTQQQLTFTATKRF